MTPITTIDSLLVSAAKSKTLLINGKKVKAAKVIQRPFGEVLGMIRNKLLKQHK